MDEREWFKRKRLVDEEEMFDKETLDIVKRVSYRNGLYLGLPLGASAGAAVCILVHLAFIFWGCGTHLWGWVMVCG